MKRALNGETLAKIDRIVDAHRGELGPVKLMLHDVQHELGYIPFEAMEKIAEAAGVSVAEVFGVVTFYTQFTTEPKGKHIINVCLGTACYVKGSQKVLEKLSEELKIPVGDTTDDGLFTLSATRCLGACGLAPVMTINDEVYGRLTPDQIPAIIAKYRG